MLKSHHNLLEPRPADRVRVGERQVDIPLREISAADGGEPVRITLKALNVLMTLIAHAGKPVSREALLEWVWPDTLPTDDVLTQAVTQLRKALGDDRDRPRYIETIAKQGYRLVAPIEWLPDPAEAPTFAAAPSAVGAPTPAASSGASTGDPLPAAAAPRSRRTWIWAAAGILALAGGVAYIGSRGARMPSTAATREPGASATGSPARPRPFDFLRIASQPDVEERPSLSPDGALVVYSRSRSAASDSASLVIQTSAATSPRALTELQEGRSDDWPVWSPDGRRIAFVRDTGDKSCRVMEIPAAGGSPRELGDCLGGQPHSLSWYPDGSALIAAGLPGPAGHHGAGRALYRMPIATGVWEPIVYDKSPTDEDVSPQVSPDGRWIAFQRNLSLGDLWRVPVGGGAPERLTRLRTNLYGLTWTPDGEHLVFSRYADGEIVLSALEIASGRVVDFRSGSDTLMHPAIARNTGALVFDVSHARERSRRLDPADGDKALQRSQVVFESSGATIMPSPSPDGRQMLFVSDRTGDLRLWWADLQHPDSLRSFEGFTPIPRYPAAWRDDARAALVVGRDRSGVTGLYEIDPAAGRLVRLPLSGGEPVYAAYHPVPGRLLVVADRGDGRLGAVLYDRASTPWRALAEAADVSRVAVDPPHRRILLSSMSSSEIRSADYDLANVVPVDRAAGRRRNRALVAAPDGMMLMESTETCEFHWRPVAVAGGGSGPGRCLGAKGTWLESVAMSRTGPELYVSLLDAEEVDVGLIPVARLLDAFDDSASDKSATH